MIIRSMHTDSQKRHHEFSRESHGDPDRENTDSDVGRITTGGLYNRDPFPYTTALRTTINFIGHDGMHSDHDPYDDEDQKKQEPTLKDALMPEKPRPRDDDAPQERPLPRDTYGEAPSLKDALLPKDHVPSPPTATAPPQEDPPLPEAKPAPKPAPKVVPPVEGSPWILQTIIGVSIAVGFIVVFFIGRASNTDMPQTEDDGEVATSVDEGIHESTDGADSNTSAPESVVAAASSVDWGDPGPMSLAAMQAQRMIIDVHEHIESLEEAPKFLAAMDALGIQKVCLMGSSKFTLTLNESFGFTQYDENNEELIKIIEAYPGRFEAWPTLSPTDPDKLSKIQGLVARGATGVKLYIGHGYVAKNHTYMFHTAAMDDPDMMPFYAWCEENGVPLALHVNPYKDKIGFAEEFVAVLTQFPDMKVIAPHFILSSVQIFRLEELLDTFPNLYTDVSFGDYFMKDRLRYISKFPKKFQRIFNKYPTRFMFASDLVMIKGRPDDWAPTQLQAYIDMLTKEHYTTAAIPGEKLNGLALSDELASRVLFRNYLELRASQPQGTKITREINWERMSVDPVDRKPGQAFPPKPKTR